jgi:hypothetical protein
MLRSRRQLGLLAQRGPSNLFIVLFCAARSHALDLPPNQWVQLSRDEKGARRHSSFRYADRAGVVLQWGFIGHVTEYYGGPDEPPEETPEYDIVELDPEIGRWRNHLPVGMEEEWSRKLPPLHMCSSYQGITTGSHRPQLRMREGVLRPDLNLVFDQVTYDSTRNRMVYFLRLPPVRPRMVRHRSRGGSPARSRRLAVLRLGPRRDRPRRRWTRR